MKNSEKTLDMIVNLCKNRGFVFAGSEIYGGLANSWDYGPLGVEFKNNVKKAPFFKDASCYLECLGGESRNQVFQMYWIAPVYDISAI